MRDLSRGGGGREVQGSMKGVAGRVGEGGETSGRGSGGRETQGRAKKIYVIFLKKIR